MSHEPLRYRIGRSLYRKTIYHTDMSAPLFAGLFYIARAVVKTPLVEPSVFAALWGKARKQNEDSACRAGNGKRRGGGIKRFSVRTCGKPYTTK